MAIMIPRMRGTITEMTTPVWRFSFVGVHSILYHFADWPEVPYKVVCWRTVFPTTKTFSDVLTMLDFCLGVFGHFCQSAYDAGVHRTN